MPSIITISRLLVSLLIEWDVSAARAILGPGLPGRFFFVFFLYIVYYIGEQGAAAMRLPARC